MKLFFENGGGKCYVVSAGLYSEKAVDDDKLISATAKVKSLDEPTLIVIPEGAPLGIAKYIPIAQAAINQCAEMKDRFAILDVPIADPKKKFEASDITEFRKLSGDADHIRYSASYYPYLKSTITYSTDMGALELATVKKNGVDDAANVLKGKKLGEIQATNNSAYHAILSELKGKLKVVLPPSPAMAGIYARVDSSRGVWKAPANVSVQSVSGPTQILTDADQGDLNMDSVGGKSINVIRAFSGRGTIVWGGRTLDGNSNEWRYVNVRRFFNMVEESVQKSTVWAVFEPNTKNTWVMVKSMIENYLITKWQQGALAGAKPDDAFYVKVGLGVTMTADDILNGIMNVEIGMAVARPAEFIVLKFSHKMQVS
jgi:phage tail sheath protein FI